MSAEAQVAAVVDPAAGLIAIDTQRTCLQRTFFSHFRFDSMQDLIEAVGETRIGLATIAKSHDVRALLYSGWVYWFLFLRGYLEYVEAGQLADGNVYLEYMLRYYAPRRHDPGVAEFFRRRDSAIERIEARYRTLSQFALAAEEEAPMFDDVTPVVVILQRPLPNYPLKVFTVDALDAVEAGLVDGWHRLFGAHLFGIESVPGVVRIEEGA